MTIRVLLVEDNPGDAFLVTGMLGNQECEAAGGGAFKVVHFERLIPALESLENCPVDVALLDMSLPDSHGIETLQRTRTAAPHVPIVVLTGSMSGQMNGIDALHEGAQDYLVKDHIDADQLGRTIRYALARKVIEEELIEARETIRRANEGLERRVEERTRELVEANRSLENLLYVISHDLREPVRGVELLAEKLIELEPMRGNVRAQDLKQRILRATERMRRHLDDVLELSRTVTMAPGDDRWSADDIVQDALQRLETPIRETGARVRVAPGLPILRGHRAWATQAVTNLLANALKFTKPGEAPEIEVVAYRGESDAPELSGIIVLDRGPGVPGECEESIFEIFRRAVGRDVDGTGSGLAIVSSVAKRHGGRAWVRPREGGGSEFVMAFRAIPESEVRS